MRSLWRRRSVKLAAALVLLAGGPAFGQQGHFRHRGYVRPPQPYCPPPQFVIPPAACPPVVPPQPVPSDTSDSSVPSNTSDSQNSQDSANPPATDNSQSPQNPPQNSVDNQLNNTPPAQQQFNDALANINRQGDGFSGDAPDIAGDFLGFVNTSDFFAGGDFAPLSLSVFGGNLDSLFAQTDINGDCVVFLPHDLTANGVELGQDVELIFNGTDGLLNEPASNLSASQREALLVFLSQQGTQQLGRSASLDESQLGTLRASKVGPDTAALELSGTEPNFLVGGFRQGTNISLPRTGSTVSRYKVGEQSNPIPRDRFIFNYGAYNSVQYINRNINVQRFVPGIERTFNDGNSSIEVRMPFASTLDSIQPISGTGALTGGSNTELGNLTATLKHLIASGENAAISAGLVVELPTADDLEFTNRATYIRRNSESVHLGPFLGGLVTPTERTFFQAFTQLSFDTNGETVVVTDRYAAASGTGRLQDPATFFADLQAGAWAYRNLEAQRLSQLSGIAGILELHFNQTLQDSDALTRVVGGNEYRFGNPQDRFGVTNLTAGSTFEFGQQSTLTCAYVVPLTDRDRQFDNEFQVLFSHYFDKRGSPMRVPSAMRNR